MLWAKDISRINLELQIPAGTPRDNFLELISDAGTREKDQLAQKREGESLVAQDFNSKLKSQSQWGKLNTEFNSVLSRIIRKQGIPLTYVIRADNEAVNDSNDNYED